MSPGRWVTVRIVAWAMRRGLDTATLDEAMRKSHPHRTVKPWCDCAEDGFPHPPGYVHQWRCTDCGYECDSRWLMCPMCTTLEDWAKARAAIRHTHA